MSKTENKTIIAVSLLILYIAMAGLIFTPGMLVGHDTMFHVLRIENLAEAIRHHDFFPQMFPNMNNGYGYGIPLFYSNTFLYLPAVLNALGLNIIICYKIFILFVIAAAEFICFFSMYQITGNRYTSLIITLFYLGSAYFAIDIYVRAAIGELLAYIFYPLIILGINRNIYGTYKNNWPLVVGFSCVALSHNLSLMMFALFFLLMIILNIARYIREPGRISALILNAVTSVCISAFFLFPMAEQFLNATFFSDYAIKEFNPSIAAVRLKNLFITIAPTGYDYVPSLGITVLICILLTIADLKNKTEQNYFRCTCFIAGIIGIFMTTGHFPYAQLDPLFNVLQFPWRWFVVITMFLAIAAGLSFTDIIAKRNNKFIHVGVILILLITCVQFGSIAIPNYIKALHTDPETAYNTFIVHNTDRFMNVDEMYLNGNNIRKEWRSRDGLPHSSNEEQITLNGSRDYNIYAIVINSDSDKEESIELPIVYYYGQEAVDDNGNSYQVHPSWRGYSEIQVNPKYSGTVYLQYEKTMIQKVSGVFSIITMIVLLAYEIKYTQRKSQNA